MAVAPATPSEDAPWTIDELLRQRSLNSPQCPLVAYPSDGTDYIDYTGQQLDVYAYRVAKHYAKTIEPRKSSSEPAKVVGLLAPSDIDYLVSALALSKLGMTVLFLSTRISDEAYRSLLQSTKCNDIVVSLALQQRLVRIQSQRPELNVQVVATSSVYSYPFKENDLHTALDQNLDHSVENQNVAWIIHSSGSTGLPKPIYQSHAAALRNYANHFDMRGFITLPLYHAHGLSSVMRAISSRKQIHMYNASLPLTGPTILATMTKFNFEIFYGVPYALKLLSETSQGLTALSKMKMVMFGGSSCPQELGDRLVDHGVHVISHYGT